MKFHDWDKPLASHITSFAICTIVNTHTCMHVHTQPHGHTHTPTKVHHTNMEVYIAYKTKLIVSQNQLSKKQNLFVCFACWSETWDWCCMLGKHSATELQPRSFFICFVIASFMQTRTSLYVYILCWPQIPYSPPFASCGLGLQTCTIMPSYLF